MFAGMLAVSLASYVQLAKHSLQLSQRTLWANAAMNLAENGLEEAMHSINRRSEDRAYSWRDAGWQTDDDDEPEDCEAWRKWTNLQVDGAARGEIRVFVYGYKSERPEIVAVGTVVPPEGSNTPKVEKWVLIQARRTSRFASGLVARKSILFKGASAKVDSWISKSSSGASLLYHPDRARDQASIGSTSVAVDAVSVNNARIWGYVATGGELPQIGPQGSIGDRYSRPGFMDMNRVSTDFVANFEAGFTSGNVKGFSSRSQPTLASELPAFLSGLGKTGKYSMASLSVKNINWTITGLVELFLQSPSGSKALIVEGNGSITVAPGASLTIYTVGDVFLEGNGVISQSKTGETVNSGLTGTTAGNPAAFQLYGQSTLTQLPQKIIIQGNSAFSGSIYAPNADVTFSGGGTSDQDILGSIVASTIEFRGNVAFHQDESLATLTPKAPFRPVAWNELVSESERNDYKSDIEDI
jgi:hypothetical protein